MSCNLLKRCNTFLINFVKYELKGQINLIILKFVTIYSNQINHYVQLVKTALSICRVSPENLLSRHSVTPGLHLKLPL